MNRREFAKRLTAIASGASFSLLAGGCASRLGPPAEGPREPAIRVTLLAPFTGQFAADGPDIERAVRLAARSAGDQAVLTVEDTGSTSASVSQAALRAAAIGSDAVIGPVLSRQALAVWQATEGRLPVFCLGNDPALLNTGIRLVGITPDESVAAIMQYAASRGVRRIAVLGDGDIWSRQCAAAAAAFASPIGLELVAARQAPAGLEATAIADILRHAPDAVLLPPGGEGLARLSPHARAMNTQLLGTHQWMRAADAGEAPEDGWFCLPDPQAGSAFANLFMSRHDTSPGHLAALAHDAMLAALQPMVPGERRGATGRLRFAPDGSMRRGLVIAVTQRGGARQVPGVIVS